MLSSHPGAEARTAPLHDAATVVILRERASALEVLLLRRLPNLRFAGGEWVFPGGVIDAADGSAESMRLAARPAVRLLDKLCKRSAQGPVSEGAALALLIGACREVFEESGILLARQRDGRLCNAEQLHRLRTERAALAGTAGLFADLLAREQLELATDELVLWSTWITPAGVPRRFDTRFFLTRLPQSQDVTDRLGEASAARWVALADPQDWPDAESAPSAPPTLLTLRELAALYARHPSLRQLLDAARSLRPVTVMAKMVNVGGIYHGLMPWDEEYAAAPGDGVACDSWLRERLGHFPSRVRLKEQPRERVHEDQYDGQQRAGGASVREA